MALYVALVVAHPMSSRMRLIGLAVGLPAIALGNLLRLLGVAFASEHLSQPAFAFAHDFVFKVVMVLFIVALWGWLLLAARRDAPQT
jgi:exosortase/archaeosortase family protein